MDLTAHELGRSHFAVWKDFIQILVVIFGQNLRENLGSFPDINHPVALGVQLVGGEFNIARVRGSVQATGGTEGGMLVEAVCDHEGIAYAQTKSATSGAVGHHKTKESDEEMYAELHGFDSVACCLTTTITASQDE